jgi:hypothetical protein
MTPKRFATKKVPSATSAVAGYLQAQREFLQGYTFLHPILSSYDRKELPPTLTMQTIQSALLDHALQHDIQQAQAKMEKQAAREASPKNGYAIKLFCKFVDKRSGEVEIKLGQMEKVHGYRIFIEGVGARIVETREEAEGYTSVRLFELVDAIWQANDFGSAMRIADRKLYGREDSIYAAIENTQGKTITTYVNRGDAVARILPPQKHPFSKRVGGSSKSLNFGVKAAQTRDVWHLKQGR